MKRIRLLKKRATTMYNHLKTSTSKEEAEFKNHFEKYGEIVDSVIMKGNTGVPRGFGFVTFADSSVRDKVIKETHILNGKEVDIKPAIPEGSINSNERKTNKIFVGGIPLDVNDDEFKECFMQFGEVKRHLIIRQHASGRSRGFGFITYESEEMVDLLLEKGNRIELGGALVDIKKGEQRKPNPSRWSSDSRSSFSGNYGDSYGGGYSGSTGGYGNGSSGGYGGGSSGGYGGEFGGYGGGYGSGVGPYRGEPPSGYSGYSGPYGGGGGSGYNIGGYGVGGSGGPYGASSGPSSSYGGGYGTGGSGLLGAYDGAGTEGYNSYGIGYNIGGYNRGGRGGGSSGGPSYGSSRYHPYGRF